MARIFVLLVSTKCPVSWQCSWINISLWLQKLFLLLLIIFIYLVFIKSVISDCDSFSSLKIHLILCPCWCRNNSSILKQGHYFRHLQEICDQNKQENLHIIVPLNKKQTNKQTKKKTNKITAHTSLIRPRCPRFERESSTAKNTFLFGYTRLSCISSTVCKGRKQYYWIILRVTTYNVHVHACYNTARKIPHYSWPSFYFRKVVCDVVHNHSPCLLNSKMIPNYM